MKVVLLAIGLTTLGSAAGLSLNEEVQNFKSWKRLTAQPVSLPDPYAFYCAPPTPRNPHNGYLIHTYANPTAEAKATAALEEIKRDDERKLAMSFPEGSILVKSKFGDKYPDPKGPKFDPAKTYPIQLLTVMIKGAKGTSPKTGDWDFLVMDGAGKKLLGKQDSKPCWNCHQDAPADGAFLKYKQ